MIRRLAKAAMSRPWPYRLLHRRALAKRPLTILCYHTLGADRGGPDAWTALRVRDFRAQVQELRKTYEIVPLDTALRAGGDRPRAVLTFDDGDRGLYHHLLPLLQDDPIPVTLYIATGQIETGKPYWFDRVMNACRGPGRLEIDLGDVGRWTLQGTGAARWQVQSDLHDALKRASPQAREELADRIQALAPDLPGPDLGPMTRAQLQALAALPQVTIAAHSHCHNLLDQIPLAQVRRSLARNRSLLQDWTGQPIRHFAYPNGNHTADLRALVADMGFASATALDNALALPGADPYALSRLAIGRYEDIPRFRLRLAGL
ncbi:polysaccharide deacetylase family protein [Sedimentitalea sp. XS_ASV28]|uniref:polysaccharide deacetylase family protein n=1 Tax=Sedimentitalea sp. XS_ASV28 TaxID=3241296 RepID=UPI00351463EB